MSPSCCISIPHPFAVVSYLHRSIPHPSPADRLLDHPNVDVVQQQLLLPLLEAARARDAAAAAAAAEAAARGDDAAEGKGGGKGPGKKKGKGQQKEQKRGGGGGRAVLAAAEHPPPPPPPPLLLRIQLVTLAPCVSDYTLAFLRQMAFNISEGRTYSGAGGGCRGRGGGGVV